MIKIEDITLCIPTVSRPSELDDTLSNLVGKIPNIIVLLNGVKDIINYSIVENKYKSNVKFINIDKTLGVASAWNYLIINTNTRWVILSSDDLFYPEGWHDSLLDELNSRKSALQISLSWPMTFSSFCIDKTIITKIGWFDQNFLTAYYEDEDWYLRLREYYKLHGNSEVTYENIVPFLKVVERKPHKNTNYNSLPNYLYFRLKWRKRKSLKCIHSRENVPYVRIKNEPKWNCFNEIVNDYLRGDYSKKTYVFSQNSKLLLFVKWIGSKINLNLLRKIKYYANRSIVKTF